MRAVVQRVRSASVTVDRTIVGEIGPGLLVLLGVAPGDTDAQIAWLSHRISGLRVFEDADGKMNRSVLDDGLAVLVVSQFTLYGDCRKGMRPGFTAAAHPTIAEPLYERFCDAMSARGVRTVARGVFGADMAVALLNEGPVTLILDTP